MSWCDKLASTPSVGFKLDYHFASGDEILHALGPILNNWVEGDKSQFSILRHESFVVELSTNDGFHYGVEPSKIHVTFTHKMKVKPVSGGPPVMEMLSTVPDSFHNTNSINGFRGIFGLKRAII